MQEGLQLERERRGRRRWGSGVGWAERTMVGGESECAESTTALTLRFSFLLVAFLPGFCISGGGEM